MKTITNNCYFLQTLYVDLTIQSCNYYYVTEGESSKYV